MKLLVLAVPAILLLSSCTKSTGGGQHATVDLRDGTSVTGTVLSSSASQIQIAGDDKITRTIPMSQVRSIEYDQAPPAPDASAQAPGQPPAGQPGPGPYGGSSAASGPGPYGGSAPTGPGPYGAPPSQPGYAGANPYHPTEAAITTHTFRLSAGTRISVRTEETIDSDKVTEGQTFPADVTENVRDADGAVVIPRGANAQIVIRSVSRGGRIRGASDLVLDLAAVAVDGRAYELSTSNLVEKGREGVGANRRTGEFAGGGAAIGAIIGAIAGGGEGAAVGAGSGAGAGALTQIFTRGRIKVPVESILTFRLDRSLRVVASQ